MEQHNIEYCVSKIPSLDKEFACTEIYNPPFAPVPTQITWDVYGSACYPRRSGLALPHTVIRTTSALKNMQGFRAVRNFRSRWRLNRSRCRTVFILHFYKQWGYERDLTTPWRGSGGPPTEYFVKICLHLAVILPYSCQCMFSLYGQIFLWSYKKVDGASDLKTASLFIWICSQGKAPLACWKSWSS